MSEAFDPYRRWLGIAPHEQPPHHYRLLGIALFEDDPDVIEGAADRQMAHVRTFQSGKYGVLSQRILNELAAAKVVLLNPEKKSAYDAQLHEQLAEPAPPSIAEPPAPAPPEASSPPLPLPPLPMPAPAPAPAQNLPRPAPARPPQRDVPQLPPAPVPAAPPSTLPSTLDPNIPRGKAVSVPNVPMAPQVPQLPVVGKSRGGVSARARARSKSSFLPMLLGLIGVGAAVAGVLVYIATQSTEEPENLATSNATTDANKTAPEVGEDLTKGNTNPPSPAPSPAPVPDPQSGSTPPPNKPPELSPAEKFRAAIGDARAALKNRQLSKAKAALTEAEFTAVASEAEPAAELARVRKLYEYVDEFWRGVRDGIYKKSEVGDVLPAERGQGIELVKREGEQVTYKTEGQGAGENSSNINALPASVATAFARRGMDASPQSRLCIAAFLLCDGKETQQRERAKALWVEAAERGVKDAAVAAELGLDEAFVASIERQPEEPEEEEVLPKIKLETSESLPAAPRDAELLAAKKVLAERFGMDLARARNKPEQAELLLPMLLEAIEKEQDLALKFVLIEEALDVAATALRVDALTLVDTKGATWADVDVLREKQLALAKYRPLAGPALESVTAAAEEVSQAAAEQERLDVAIAALNIAIRHAGRIKERDPRELQKRLRELEARNEFAQRATAARTTLESDPQNAVAHQDLGRYLCYYSNQWDEGLPHLARGEMEEEAQLAADDLAMPSDPVQQAQLGERWYQLAKKKVGPSRAATLWRAKSWLDQALPKLTDDARVQAENRLRDIAKESAPVANT